MAPRAVNGLRKSSITVMRHMLASMKTRRKNRGELFFPISRYTQGRRRYGNDYCKWRKRLKRLIDFGCDHPESTTSSAGDSLVTPRMGG